MTQATGFAYEVVVTMDKSYWDNIGGEAIKYELNSPVQGLPQSEPSMKITYVQPKDFSGLLRYVRNILKVEVDPSVYTKVSFTSENNVWAKNQVFVTLKAPSEDAIASYMKEHEGALVNFFVKVEMDRAISQLSSEYSNVVIENLKRKFDVEIKAPANFTYFKDTTNFFWSSNNANTGRMDLVVYSFPYTDPNTFTEEYLVAKRDSFFKENLPGSFPGSYMQTEKRAGISYEEITQHGKYCGVLRGLWRMEGDMMGGPFVSHARLDEQNQRVVVAEGFVYAPETDKRNLIRRMEAVLYTLTLPGDVENTDENVK